MDILRHWGLRERPFETTLDARFFYASPVHNEALARLALVAEDGDMGMALLTGEIGSGKTFVATVFARTLDPRRFAAVFLPGAGFGFECILDEVNCCLKCRAPTGSPASRYALYVEFRKLVETRLAALGLHLVVVIDEAQELSSHDFRDLRALSNAAAGARNAMTIILVGSPDLRARVKAIPAVDARVGLRFHMGYMPEKDVAPYLAHRLSAAGHGTGRVFTDDAAALLASASGGAPRGVNRLAKLAMYAASSAALRPTLRGRSADPPAGPKPLRRSEGPTFRAATSRAAQVVTDADVGSVAEDMALSAGNKDAQDTQDSSCSSMSLFAARAARRTWGSRSA